MSRTKRKYAWPTMGKQAYIDYCYDPRCTRWSKTRKSKAVYRAEVAQDERQATPQLQYTYDAQTQKWEHQVVLVRTYVSRYIRTYDIPYPREEQERDNAAKYETYHRDGKFSETGCRTGFKKKAARELRQANRRYCTNVMHDIDYHEDSVHPCRYEQKYLIWAFW